jgi:hypothetical protein
VSHASRHAPGAGPSAARWIAAAAGVALVAGQATGATFRVDDSMSLPNNATATMRWKSGSPARTSGDPVEGSARVTIRLNLAPWLGKSGRIYMTLAQQPEIGQVTAEWTTQGRLLPGTVISGQRTLVYSGSVRSALLEETIVVKVVADGRRLAMPQRLEFSFEIDVD